MELATGLFSVPVNAVEMPPSHWGVAGAFVHHTCCSFYAQSQEIGSSSCQGLLWSSWWTFREHFKLGKGSWPSTCSGCCEPSSWPMESTQHFKICILQLHTPLTTSLRPLAHFPFVLIVLPSSSHFTCLWFYAALLVGELITFF